MFGTENRSPVDLIYAECSVGKEIPECKCKYVEWLRNVSREASNKAREHLKNKIERNKCHYDKNTHLRKFSVGDWVWLFNSPDLRIKTGKRWIGPFLVVQKLGNVDNTKCIRLKKVEN